ncbi:hypothetical protein [Hymenobacter siberiensis]|jgi:hypothetical protein|uniref:hypothetical protein n=1 Tax=Hymenobacter siberiensis TaxID=2848396 RepID=UPI001C1E6501|nr:hypothetical protein [Hymenobacter siberiensis]MBU6122940.1 hypothetical protein [Hymenobacter siberiensis]
MSDIINRPGSDEEWEDLMRQLRHQPVAQPRPFFYARVQARLVANAGAPRQWLPAWLRQPAYAVLLGALVLALSGDGPALTSAAVRYHASPPSGLKPLPPR